MKIYVSSPLMAQDTVYGYEARYLDFARKLMEEGITPHDLKEHYHDFEWVANLVSEQVDIILRRAIGGYGEDVEIIKIKKGGENG